MAVAHLRVLQTWRRSRLHHRAQLTLDSSEWDLPRAAERSLSWTAFLAMLALVAVLIFAIVSAARMTQEVDREPASHK